LLLTDAGIAGEVWQLCASLRLRLLTAALLLLRTVAAREARSTTAAATATAQQQQAAAEDIADVARHALAILKHTCSTLRLLSLEQALQQTSAKTSATSSSSFAAAAGDSMDTDEPAVAAATGGSTSSSSSSSGSDSTEHLFSVCMAVLQELSVLRSVQAAALQQQERQQQQQQYGGALPYTSKQLDKQWESVAAEEGLVPLLLQHLR
jgi:hypothetical protein